MSHFWENILFQMGPNAFFVPQKKGDNFQIGWFLGSSYQRTFVFWADTWGRSPEPGWLEETVESDLFTEPLFGSPKCLEIRLDYARIRPRHQALLCFRPSIFVNWPTLSSSPGFPEREKRAIYESQKGPNARNLNFGEDFAGDVPGGDASILERILPGMFQEETLIRKGRTWDIAVRRGSYKSLFLPNSGHFFSLEK